MTEPQTQSSVPSFPSIITTRRTVPNEQPLTDPGTSRIAIIGEAPGEDEENHRRPFVGKSGQFLNAILRDVGIDRTKCFVGNVCQVRPPANRIEAFEWNEEEIQSGLATLSSDLERFAPNLCVLLGNTPLRAAKGPGKKITSWRGSLCVGDSSGPFFHRKCIPSLHPAGVLREFSGFPLLKFDLARAASEGSSPLLQLPHRDLTTSHDPSHLCFILDHWPAGLRCSLDIEGGLPLWMVNTKKAKKNKEAQTRYGWPCVSLAASPTSSFTIAWGRMSEPDHIRVLRSFARLMARTNVPKVLQNQLYDNFVLSFGYGIPIRNVTEDVMIKGWEIYAELPRSLAVQASIYTRQPFWKDDSMYSSDGEGLYRGCALDSAVTLEICNAQDSILSGPSLIHYRRMIEMQNPFLYMELRGIKYDQEKVTSRLAETEADIAVVRARISESAGRDLCGDTSLSSKKLIECLYREKGYPPQYKKEAGRKTEKLTSDIEAILTLKRHHPHDQFLSDILRHRHLEGIRETLNITADPDGRVRCGYSLEAETGRVKCYTSPTGSGANLQTIQKDLRENYIADPGHDFFQCDLEGADGWTVAAHCARLGDRTMLEDYLAGLKPAKIVALLYALGPDINRLDRESLKFAHDRIFPIVKKEVGEWVYLGSKRVQHGSNYLMGIPTMLLNILKDSYKESGVPLYLDHAVARALQDNYFARYFGVKLWQKWGESKLVADGKLTAASGHTRIFFGRRFGSDIKDTVKEFLAHEPQNVTTWATNLAVLNLWNDPDNRVESPDTNPQWSDYQKVRTASGLELCVKRGGRVLGPGSLIIEPLHQIHDALCGQWPSSVRDWARTKVRSYFKNVINIAGIDLVIPFDGAWGPSWGETKNPL